MTARRPLLSLPLVLAFAVPSVAADDAAARSAEALYVERCGMCHRAGGMGTGLLARRPDAGTGLLEERRDLLEPFVTAVVRSGSGNMPRIPRGEVSDAELARIAAYLARKVPR